MLNYYESTDKQAPDISININCDTILALDTSSFTFGEHDELIFILKNIMCKTEYCIEYEIILIQEALGY